MSTERYRWLVGGAWAGKTSLLAEAVTAALPDEVDVVAYFLSRPEADADSGRFLAAVIPQLTDLLELDEEPPSLDQHQFRALWERAAERAAAEDRPLLLVVDGLDEDLRPPGLPTVARILPFVAGGRAHVLVSSRPHLDLRSAVPSGHPLASTPVTEVEPFAFAQELAHMARQEIDDLTMDKAGLAVEVLGLLTAAAGPLAVEDLATMAREGPRSTVFTRRVRQVVTAEAARSLQPVGPDDGRRYQFAHDSLLAHAQSDPDLGDPEFRRRIHGWAQAWRDAGWPSIVGGDHGTPRYLLDTYASTLIREPQRLTALVSDVAWIVAAIRTVGVDRVLVDLRRAVAADRTHTAASGMLAAVAGQAHHLRSSAPLDQPGYVLRQLWLQAAELTENALAGDLRARLLSEPDSQVVPLWTTRRSSHILSAELGRHDDAVQALAVLPDGRVVSGSWDNRLMVWDPATPGSGPFELGRHDASVLAVAALSDGRVISGGDDGRLLLWDPATPGFGPLEVGHNTSGVWAVQLLPDGRVVSGDRDGAVLVWDLAKPGTAPLELGHHVNEVRAAVVLLDGRVVSGSVDRWLMVWDPTTPGRPLQLGRHAGAVLALAALSDGRVVSGGGDRAVLVWDAAKPGTAPLELGRHYNQVWAVAVLPDGRVVSGGDDQRLLLWEPAHPGAAPLEVGRHDSSVQAVAALPDGRVISGGRDDAVLVWRPAKPATGSLKPDLDDGSTREEAVLFDRRMIRLIREDAVLVSDPSNPGTAPLELDLHLHDSPLWGVAVLPDGRVITCDNRLMLWDPAKPGTWPLFLGRCEVAWWAVAALPDGRVVSGGWDNAVLVWDPNQPGTGPVEVGRHEDGVWAVATLPDGRVVSGGLDNAVLVWDPATPGSGPLELGHHDASVLAVAVLRDGRVISGGDDHRLLVWDTAKPQSGPVELGRHDRPVRALAVLPDGSVVSGGDDRRVLIWDVTTQTEIAQLRCPVYALATGLLRSEDSTLAALAIAHAGAGFSLWAVTRSYEE